MSTSSRIRRASRAVVAAGLLAFGLSSAARAESEGGALPPAQYASLPSGSRLKDPALTDGLPRVDRSLSGPVPQFYNAVSSGMIVLRDTTPTTCLPGQLLAVVADVSSRFGHVSIESTHRTLGRNRRAGGAEHSLHLACRAMDFRPHDHTRGIMAYLRSRPDVGGLKMYRNGIIHIDNGSRRSW